MEAKLGSETNGEEATGCGDGFLAQVYLEQCTLQSRKSEK